MKKLYSQKVILLCLILYASSTSITFAQLKVAEVTQDMKSLTAQTARLLNQMTILDKQVASSVEAADLRRELGVFTVDMLHVIELGTVWLSVESRYDRQQARAGYLRSINYFIGGCYQLHEKLKQAENETTNQIFKSCILTLNNIISEMIKILQPSLDIYNQNAGKPEYTFYVDGEEAEGLNMLVSSLFTEISFLQKMAVNDSLALLINQQLETFVLQADQVNILFPLWFNATSEIDKKAILASLINEIQDIRETYHTAIYNLNVLRLEINNDDVELSGTALNIDRILSRIDRWLAPYEEEFVKTNKEAALKKEARERKAKVQGLEAEGIYQYAFERYDAAIKTLNEAISLDPLYPEAQYYLALSYIKTGERSQAIKSLRIFLKQWTKAKQSPKSKKARKALENCAILLNKLKN